MTRKRIFEIIEKADYKDKLSAVYDYLMILMIVLSLIPLAFKTDNLLFRIIDKVTVAVFIIDYALRWVTADYKFERHEAWSLLQPQVPAASRWQYAYPNCITSTSEV